MADEKRGGGVLSFIIRLIVIMIILAVTSFLTPGFRISGLISFLIAALVITILDYVVEKIMGVDASPFGKGIKGFIISAIIIYITQLFVPNMQVSIIGALIAALVIGILDAILPGNVF